mgnify:CR=1 FL=1|jgi:hypothetical protein
MVAVCGAAGPERWSRLRAAFGVYKTIRRQRTAAGALALCQLQQKLQEQQLDAAAAAVALVACEDSKEKGARRTEVRALGKWRGSTLSGYLNNDDTSRLNNFRCRGKRLDDLVELLRPSQLAGADDGNVQTLSRGRRVTRKARECVDPPTLRYKVATCMYAMAFGGPVKVIADAASIGESTLRKWLEQFSDGVAKCVKPVYMPGKPWSEEERRQVQGQFASRRGIEVASLACDGSHIPFHPKNKRIALDYRNYKGWTSILSVNFVDSFYRFFEVDVGYPGRAGDNTVLKRSAFMQELDLDPDKWLGVGGVVLGDSGASDGDRIFLNPYHNPFEPEKCWFNFCHSSTRFFVEQAFGIWKSRFRFLMHSMPGVNHRVFTKMIYASAVLHNFLLAGRGEGADDVSVDVRDPGWQKHFEAFKAQMCPTCIRNRVPFCVHQAPYRNGVAQAKTARDAPSEVREKLCKRLWEEVIRGPDASAIRASMSDRAHNGIQRDE